MTDTRAVVLAAGLGSRLRPFTETLPKPMLPVLDRPILGYVIDHLHSHGVHDIMVTLHYRAEAVREAFKDEVRYAIEDRILGTAGGMYNCRSFVGSDPFLVMCGDALTSVDLTALLAAHRDTGGLVTFAVQEVRDPGRYGVVLCDESGRIHGFAEKPREPAGSLVSCGIFVLEPAVFDLFPAGAVDWSREVVPALLEANAPMYAYPCEGYWNDIGTPEDYRRGSFELLTGAAGIRSAVAFRMDGVIVRDGAAIARSAVLEPPVWVGAGAVVERQAMITGPSVISRGAHVAARGRVVRSIVLPGATVTVGARLAEGILG